MMQFSDFRAMAIGVVFGLAGATGAANANMITMTTEFSASGSVDGVPFAATDIVLTAIGDTGDRLDGATAYVILHTSMSISIDGVGDFDFSMPPINSWTFMAKSSGLSGAGRDGTGNLTGFTHASLVGWDMLSSIGPLFSPDGIVHQWGTGDMVTNGGVVILDDTQGDMTFTARVVPAPATALALGAPAITLARRRRR